MQSRHIIAVLAFAAVCPLTSFAQNKASFNVQTQATGSTLPPQTVYSVDLNNDGVPDLVEVEDQIPTKFFVFLGKGDGTFKAGFTYTFSTSYQSGIAIATGDFNGDGLADLVCVLNNTRQVAVFLGKGDGTFQAPRYETISLPSGQTLGSETAAAADINGDGKLDVITTAGNSNTGLVDVLPGNGDGTFGAAVTAYSEPAGQYVSGFFATGDFDADGRADIAFTTESNCNQGGECNTALHVLYGNGGFNMTDTTAYSSQYSFMFGAGDVNSDGRTDLYAVVGLSSQRLAVLYGQTNRTFALYTQPVNANNYFNNYPGLTLADFNGDGHMDIVAMSYNSSGTENFSVFLGTSSLGTFTEQDVALPAHWVWTTPLAGDFNHDTKPDIVTIGQNSAANSHQVYIVQARNTTSSGSYGGCSYPTKGQGIHMCYPASGTQGSPVLFNASANSYGNLRKIALWVDGKKVAEQWHTWGQRAWFNQGFQFAAGTHNASFIAADVDNHLQRLKFTFNVANCTAPSSAGVHICSPANGSTVGSPVSVLAAARVNGTIQSMELWVDGAKKYTDYNSNMLNFSASLPAGKHKFSIFAINAAGAKWNSVVYATVK